MVWKINSGFWQKGSLRVGVGRGIFDVEGWDAEIVLVEDTAARIIRCS